MNSSRKSLKDLLRLRDIVVAPGAFDMVSAKIIQNAGFDAIYVSGFGQSSSHLGMPDLGIMTFTEMLERVRNTAKIVNVPLIADGDTGYGGLANVRRTIEEYESAGASAIQLEDQATPKKCGHTSDKQLIASEEMVLKIKAGIQCRKSSDFLIIARTDALAVDGLDEAIRRGKLYAKAGADILFIESPRSKEDLKVIGRSFELPLMANLVEGGKTPLFSVEELSHLGFKIAIFPVTCLLSAVKAMEDSMHVLKTNGETCKIQNQMKSFKDFTEFIGFSEVISFESQLKNSS